MSKFETCVSTGEDPILDEQDNTLNDFDEFPDDNTSSLIKEKYMSCTSRMIRSKKPKLI